MGQRGPKSMAAKVHGGSNKKTWKGKPPWEKKGLSRAERVIAFVEVLPITAGIHAGRKMILRPWQKEIIQALYAVDSDGLRVVRTGVISLPRKQGKTALIAALIMAHLGIGPEAEPRGQIFSAAVDRTQSSLIFNEMEAWVFSIPEFETLFNVKRHEKKIECLVTGTVYAAASGDARKGHGLSPNFIAYDEAAQSPNDTLWNNLISGTAARKEPLSIIISTASPDPNHFLSQLIDFGRKIKAGELPPDPTFYLCEYSAPLDSDPWDEKTWFDCNPALGDFRSLEEMRLFAERAQKIPSLEYVFRSLYLNQPVDSDPRFVTVEDWRACGEDGELSGPCFFGLDLASVIDLTCLAGFWPDTGACRIWTWLPGEPPLRDRALQDRVPYDVWHREGWIESFPGKTTDYKAVALKMIELQERFDLQVVAFDRWRVDVLKAIISDMGAELPLEPFGQGYKDLSPAVSEMEKLIINHDLRHGDNPVLTWCMSNVKVLSDPAGNRKFDKGVVRYRRIDAAVALCMAVGIASKHTRPEELDFESSLELL